MSPIVAARQSAGAPSVARYVLLFGYGGEFVKLDASTGQVAMRSALAHIEGLASLLPSHLPPEANSADQWLVHSVVSDLAKQRVYIAIPLTSADASAGTEKSIVLSLHASLRALNGVLPVPGRPTLVLDSANDRLFVSYVGSSDTNRLTSRLHVHNTVDLARLHAFSDETTVARFERAEETPPTLLSDSASMVPDRRVIVDRLRRILVSNDKLTVEPINVASLLSSSQQSALARFYQRDRATGRDWLPYNFVASAAGVAVFVVVSRESNEMALVSVDALADRVLAIAFAPLGEIRITSDGAVAIIDTAARRNDPVVSDPDPIEKHGRLIRVDLRTGQRIDELADPSLRGDIGRAIVCVGSVNDPVVYAAGESLMLLQFGAAPQVLQTGIAFRGALQAKCGWSTH